MRIQCSRSLHKDRDKYLKLDVKEDLLSGTQSFILSYVVFIEMISTQSMLTDDAYFILNWIMFHKMQILIKVEQ